MTTTIGRGTVAHGPGKRFWVTMAVLLAAAFLAVGSAVILQGSQEEAAETAAPFAGAPVVSEAEAAEEIRHIKALYLARGDAAGSDVEPVENPYVERLISRGPR